MTKLFNSKFFWILVILYMGILAPIIIDEYAPSMPAMTVALQTSASLIQLSITFMLLGLGVGQVILGPMSDRFGRRPIIFFGLTLTVFATILCMLSHTVSLLLIGRVLQGLGAAACALTTTALIGDLFKGEDINKVTGLFVLVYGLVPIIAPVIGGHIQTSLGWRYNFGFMLLAIAVGFILFSVCMPETVDRHQAHKLHPVRLLKNYITVITHRRYITAVLGAACSWATIITFSLLAPFIIQNTLNYSAKFYGYMALVGGLGFFVGNMLNTSLLKKFKSQQILVFGTVLAVVVSLIMLGILLAGHVSIYLVMAPTVLVMFGVGFALPNYYGYAVASFTNHLTGTANALIGALILFCTVVYSSILSYFHAHSVMTLAVVYVMLSGLNFATSLVCVWLRND